jgi:branched-chain amino acid transport system permease protein
VLVAGVFVGSIYSLVSAGLTLIWGTMKIINFAHGTLMMLSMYAAFWSWFFLNLDPLLSVFLVFPLMYLVGYLIERFLIRRVIAADPLAQLLLTFGLMLVIQNSALHVWRGDIRIIHTGYESLFWNLGGVILDAPRVIAFSVAIFSAMALHLFLTKTSIGWAIRATAQDTDAAESVGIESQRMLSITFALGVALAGLAGSLLTTFFPIYPDVGTPFMFMAFVAMVLGSMGNYLGAMIGGVLMGVLESLTAYFFMSQLRQVVPFLIFILILVFAPEGLFGRALRR